MAREFLDTISAQKVCSEEVPAYVSPEPLAEEGTDTHPGEVAEGCKNVGTGTAHEGAIHSWKRCRRVCMRKKTHSVFIPYSSHAVVILREENIRIYAHSVNSVSERVSVHLTSCITS